MYWRLTDSLTACIAAERVILLDVHRDRYSALPDALNALLAGWLADLPAPLPRTLRLALVELDIIRPDSAPLMAEACAVQMPSTLDADVSVPSRLGFAQLIHIAAVVRRAVRDVRDRPLGATLAQRLCPSMFAAPINALERKARTAVFQSARPFVPVPRICLHDCLALLDWLGPSRSGCELVFGVSAFPFSAHSWIQADGCVLDDHPESVSRFEPILHFG